MNIIEQIVTALLGWIQKLAQQDRTSEDSKPNPALRDELHSKLDRAGRIPGDDVRVLDPRDPGSQR